MEFNFLKLKISMSVGWNQPPSIPPEKLLFDRLHLDGMLRPHFDNRASLIGILLSQVSVLVTIGLTLLVSDINTKWGIDKALWNFIVISTFSCLLLWSAIVTLKIFRQPSFEEFLRRITSQSLTTQDRRFVFLFVAIGQDGAKRVLVQHSVNWECWLLPNFGKSQSGNVNTNQELHQALGQKLSAEAADLLLTPMNEDMINSKQSYKNNKFTTYYFDFYFAQITSESLTDKICHKEFDIAGDRFAWLTVAELKNDLHTRERNSDVIEHLENKIFANGFSSLSTERKIGVQ
ncbi:hypothetical protein PQQ96_29270 [Paraburkholderia sediminicola]|uniref:hypothetical protein n=1 Tax=Paraburkholderia sediminicola TaxID=458836 RepID=UPI0038B97BDD